MTEEEFNDIIKNEHRSSDIINYIFAVVAFFIGVFFSYKLFQTGLNNNLSYTKYIVLVIPIIPLSLSLYSIWRIPKDYIITTISSERPISEKLLIIENYVSTLKIISHSVDGNYISFRYQNKFFNRVDVKVLITIDKINFNSQGVDRGAVKGVLDFGLTFNSAKKLAKYLNACL